MSNDNYRNIDDDSSRDRDPELYMDFLKLMGNQIRNLGVYQDLIYEEMKRNCGGTKNEVYKANNEKYMEPLDRFYNGSDTEDESSDCEDDSSDCEDDSSDHKNEKSYEISDLTDEELDIKINEILDILEKSHQIIVKELERCLFL